MNAQYTQYAFLYIPEFSLFYFIFLIASFEDISMVTVVQFSVVQFSFFVHHCLQSSTNISTIST